MNLFDPRTFSTDWEIFVVDKLERCVTSEKLMAFAGAMQHELGLPIQIDYNALELALGVNSSFAQFWDRVQTVTDRAQQLLREFDLELFPCGAHPVEEMYNASHVHVGTAHDETSAIHLENSLMRYMPAFAALAANSPAACGRRGEYKSYRVRDLAHWCSHPSDVRDPRFCQPNWGTDICPKIYGAPTVEVRVPDCASSRRFLAELATLIAAFVHHGGSKIEEDYRPSPREYREYLTNRWAAARYGMQATFTWEGRTLPVAELLSAMKQDCEAELEYLGIKGSDLAVINQMIEKRVCQADFASPLLDRYPDKYGLASAWSKLARHWEVFEEYLDSAPTLDPAPAVDDEAVVREHLEFVGEGTHFYRLRDAMCYTDPLTRDLMRNMLEKGLVRREVTPECGTLLYRTEKGA